MHKTKSCFKNNTYTKTLTKLRYFFNNKNLNQLRFIFLNKNLAQIKISQDGNKFRTV